VRNVRADVTMTVRNVDLKARTVSIVATMTAHADVTTTVPIADLKARTARADVMMTAQNAGLMAKAATMTSPSARKSAAVVPTSTATAG
jgi:hypothetical protein